jgi:hypothetical protein
MRNASHLVLYGNRLADRVDPLPASQVQADFLKKMIEGNGRRSKFRPGGSSLGKRLGRKCVIYIVERFKCRTPESNLFHVMAFTPGV